MNCRSDIQGKQQVDCSIEIKAPVLVRPPSFPDLPAGRVRPGADHGLNVLRDAVKHKGAFADSAGPPCPTLSSEVADFQQFGWSSSGITRRRIPAFATHEKLASSRLVTKGALMRRCLRGAGMRRLPVRFAAVLSGRPGKGPRGTTTRPSMKDYRRGPLGPKPRRPPSDLIRGKAGVQGPKERAEDDLPGATVNRRGGRLTAPPSSRGLPHGASRAPANPWPSGQGERTEGL